MPILETLFDDIEQYYSDINSLIIKLKENGVTTYEQFLEKKKSIKHPFLGPFLNRLNKSLRILITMTGNKPGALTQKMHIRTI